MRSRMVDGSTNTPSDDEYEFLAQSMQESEKVKA